MTTRNGIDYSFDRPTSPAAVRTAGYDFVCRYVGGSASKDLTHSEASGLVAAGLDIVCNWESSADRALSGRQAGIDDAHAALAQATAAGMPTGRPIYFSVDFNATEAQQAAINGYLDGVASVLGLARTGAYGGYWVISRLFDAGKIRWGWQTYAWSAGSAPRANAVVVNLRGTDYWFDTRAQLRQVQNGITVAGVDCDADQGVVDDFGQWGVTPLPTPQSPSEDDMGVIAKDAAGQYYHCIGGMSYPLTTPQVADVRYLAGQGVFQLAVGKGNDAEWTDGGLTRTGWNPATFGPVYAPPAALTGTQVDDVAEQVASRLVASNANGLTAADHAAVVEDVKAALRDGTGS